MSHPVVLGLDIGGSKTHALGTRGDEVLLDRVFGSASLASLGEEAAARTLDEVARTVRDWPLEAVCVGAAGADTEPASDRLGLLMRARFPGCSIRVVHDTRLVLATEHLATGIVLISGTGSVAWARNSSGDEGRAGGWGYLLGDEGSGYGIARQAVRHVLMEAESGRTIGTLSVAVLAALGLDHHDQLLPAFYARTERAHWARLAVPVLDQADSGEQSAIGIRDAATTALAELAVAVAHRCNVGGPVVLAGGLLANRSEFAVAVTRKLVPAGLSDVRVLQTTPAWGAVHLASNLASATPTPGPTNTLDRRGG